MNNNKENNVKYIKDELKSGALNSLIENLIDGDKKDLLIKENNMVYQLTTSDNQNNKEYYNISTIKLGGYENILKIANNIDLDEPLLIFKIDYYSYGSLVPIVNYEVYNPNTKEKLELDYCKDELIGVNLPVSVDKNIDKNNLFKNDPKSDYYTDICYKSTTENGTDILLNDRHKEYNDNKMALCENNCDLKQYEENTKQVTCECKIKISDLEKSGLLDDTDPLKYNFKENDLSSNMISMKCAYTLFSEEGMILNIANYIFVLFDLFGFISGILFYKFGYPSLEIIINRMLAKKSKKKNSKKDKYEESDVKAKENKEKINVKRKSSKKIFKKKKIKIKKKRFSGGVGNNQKQLISNNTNSIIISKAGFNYDKYSASVKKDKRETMMSRNSIDNIKNTINIENDFEMNTLLYADAIVNDKRSYTDYYYSLIKTKHPIIMIFISDYNSKILKMNYIIISFSLQYFFNGLFFNESTIHKIYEDQGIYNISYLWKYILISFILSHISFVVIKYYSLSERNIYNIKIQTSTIKIYEVSESEKRNMVMKYIFFYGLFLGIVSFFWYYLSSFGAVYQNTQTHLIKNVVITFCFSLLYPFLFNIIPALLRINSLKSKDSENLYKISKILQMF